MNRSKSGGWGWHTMFKMKLLEKCYGNQTLSWRYFWPKFCSFIRLVLFLCVFFKNLTLELIYLALAYDDRIKKNRHVDRMTVRTHHHLSIPNVKVLAVAHIYLNVLRNKIRYWKCLRYFFWLRYVTLQQLYPFVWNKFYFKFEIWFWFVMLFLFRFFTCRSTYLLCQTNY